MGRDGKPVPYDAFTVGPTNSNLSVSCIKPIAQNDDFRAYRLGGADFCLRPPYLCPAAVNKNEEIPLTFYFGEDIIDERA